MDFQASLYDPIYSVYGVPVRLLVPAVSGNWLDATGLDKSAGADVGDKGAQIQTIKPACKLRMTELTALGVAVENLPDAKLQMNGVQYAVTTYKLVPNPNGPRDGQVLAVVTEEGPVSDDSESESESA